MSFYDWFELSCQIIWFVFVAFYVVALFACLGYHIVTTLIPPPPMVDIDLDQFKRDLGPVDFICQVNAEGTSPTPLYVPRY